MEFCCENNDNKIVTLQIYFNNKVEQNNSKTVESHTQKKRDCNSASQVWLQTRTWRIGDNFATTKLYHLNYKQLM